MVKRPLIGVVADDITGAGDIGLMFARHGWATRLFTASADFDALPVQLANERADVVIIDTDARFDDPATAAAKVRRATAALAHWGAEVFYAKTCSVFRGPVGAYFDAMLAELGHDFGVAVAAFPKNGRVTIGGLHFVHGKPLSESEFAEDPVHPRRESDLVLDLAGQTDGRVELLPLAAVRSEPASLLARIDDARKRHVRYLLADIETQEDLGALAEAVLHEPVLLGSSAIAEELARRWPAPEPFDPFGAARPVRKGGVLVIAGSVMPQTQAQVAAMEEAGLHVVTLTAQAALDGNVGPLLTSVAYRLQQGESVVVRSENWPEAVAAIRAVAAERGIPALEASRRATATLAAFAETACGRIVALGGDTSAAVCKHLGIEEMIVVDEIAPGLPACFAVHPHPMLLVLKSGGFGDRDFGLKAIAHLEGLCHDRWT